ncbi:hypothetical protein Rhsp01_60330 [Rhizobium sp. NBRC 114257]|uniref:LacI family transcriptional regulator n=1 Tax=Rhizobium dioscoreae TaxID=2653122 RepID=A0ABQ0ZCZ9_9HYPH|nr:hypothetical protein RsS93_60790 [Rhizobium dioscoreae]GLU84857.1 hypothetical protein Rhsp01_60330 [Rhizobium sp. NBRC 114257]
MLDSSITVHRTFVEESEPEKFAAHVADSSIRRHGLIVAVEVMTQALRRCSDIIGIYNAGGANLGVGSVLQRFQERQGRDCVWIGHELNDETRRFIASGLMTLVLDQAPETQARRALDTILSRMGIIDVPVSQEPVPFLTYTTENVGPASSHH